MYLLSGLVAFGASGAQGWPPALTGTPPGTLASRLAIYLAMLCLTVIALARWRWAALQRERQRLADLRLALNDAEQREASIRAELAEVAAAAHDVRSPLVTIRSYLDLLDEGACGNLPTEARELTRRASIVSERAQTIVEETLRRAAIAVRPAPGLAVSSHFGAIDARAMSADAPGTDATPGSAAREDLDLADIVADALLALSAEIEATGALVTLGDLPPAHGDRHDLFRVFVNLIENAIKYRLPGTAPHVVIEGTIGHGRCQLLVRDYGLGIDRHDAARLFEVGARGGNTAGTHGAGLGLATVQRIIEAHDGDVWVDTSIVDGTAIRFTLPPARTSTALTAA